MKRCLKCGIDKPETEYHKDKSRKTGLRESCKDCRCKYKKVIHKKCVRCGLDFKLTGKRKLQKYCSKQCAIKTNREEKRIRDKMSRDSINSYVRTYRINRKKSDPLYRLTINIRSNVRNSFLSKYWRKDNTTKDIIGCSYEEFRHHIESQFESWMNWDNYGLYTGQEKEGWDIDHIIPISSAKTKEELIKLNHYTNLRPLCSKINRVVKKHKIINV